MSELSLVQTRDDMIYISQISVRTFENNLSSEVQFILDCTLTLRRDLHEGLNNKPTVFPIGRLELVEVDLHTLQGMFREFEQGKGKIKVNLFLNES